MKIRIGTRGSKLALTQTNIIKNQLLAFHKDIDIEIKVIKTTGDKILDTPLTQIGGKGLFVKEIEEALINNEIDIAVHSLKDLPAQIPNELIIGCIPKRENPFDVLISNKNYKLKELPKNSIVGTTSLRRKAQILNIRPDLVIKDLRGNIDTRINKLKNNDFDAIILAYAGLHRMNLAHLITENLNYLIPAACQGAIGIECRKNDKNILELIKSINDENSQYEVECERSFLSQIFGNCQVPIAALASIINKNNIKIIGLIADIDGSKIIKKELSGDIENRFSLGKNLANNILNNGGKEILKKLNILC